MIFLRRLFVLLALLTAPVAAEAQTESFDHSELSIVSGTTTHHFRIELALTQKQQEQGLMFRSAMDADAGMLFVYASPHELTMWMKNTILPLDMVFFGADGRIMALVERAVPRSEALISSGGPAKAVLELNGGTIARLGLKRGDRIVYPGFPAP